MRIYRIQISPKPGPYRRIQRSRMGPSGERMPPISSDFRFGTARHTNLYGIHIWDSVHFNCNHFFSSMRIVFFQLKRGDIACDCWQKFEIADIIRVLLFKQVDKPRVQILQFVRNSLRHKVKISTEVIDSIKELSVDTAFNQYESFRRDKTVSDP